MNCGVEVLNAVNSCCALISACLRGFRDHRLHCLVERNAAASGQILDLELEAAGSAEPGIDGGSKLNANAPGMLQQHRAARAATIFGCVLIRGRSFHGFRIANSTAELD